MKEQHLSIDTREGRMSVYACAPGDRNGGPAVILYMDVFGHRDELFELAREFAREGFLALIPDLFHRLAVSTFTPVNGRDEVLSSEALNANNVTTLYKSLNDTQALLSAVKRNEFAFVAEKISVIGYCMGGRHALAAATAFPGKIQAGLSVHGGRLVKKSPASPHLLVEKLKVPFHFAFAKDDPTCPQDHQDLIRETGRRCGAPVTFSKHDAHHGWSFPTRWSYDSAACKAVRQKALELFSVDLAEKEALGS